jgi:hypothetical protein
MVEATPSAAFVVTEADLLLEFEIVALDSPAKFGLIDHAKRDVGWQRGEPAVVRLGLGFRPLDQQPLFSRRLASPGVPRVGLKAARGQALCAGRTRQRANRVSGVLLPSRHVIVCQLSGAGSRARVLAATGRCVSSWRNRLAGRPRPELGAGGKGASPGRQTIVVGRIPAT